MNGLTQLQHDLKGRIEGCAVFAGVPVVVVTGTSEREVSILTESINRAVGGITRNSAGKSGLCIVLPLPAVSVREPNLPGPQLSATCEVQIVEESTINRGRDGTGITADDAALTLLGLIGDGWMARPWLTFLPEERAMEELGIPPEMAGDVAWQLSFRVELGVTPFPRVPAPVITVGEETVTLTCPDEDASIYYTLDDSFPGPSNTAAVLYSEAFTKPEAGTTIRAAAWPAEDAAPGTVGSDGAEVTV